MLHETQEKFSVDVIDARCFAVRLTLFAGVRLPNMVSDHLAQCPSCARVSVSDRQLAAAFLSERATSYLAPPGLVNAVIDGLGIRLPGDAPYPTGSTFDRIATFRGTGRAAIAMSSAVLVAVATGLVVGRRKRSQLAL